MRRKAISVCGFQQEKPSQAILDNHFIRRVLSSGSGKHTQTKEQAVLIETQRKQNKSKRKAADDRVGILIDL
jgi:hypothetical protein